MNKIPIPKEEAIEKYGDIELKFSSYYKYSFTFKGENDEVKIVASFGGSHDAIYRTTVKADDTHPASEAIESWSYVRIIDKKTEEEIYEDSSWW